MSEPQIGSVTMRIGRKYTMTDPNSRRRDRKAPRKINADLREWVAQHLSGAKLVDSISRPKIIANADDLTLFKIRFP